MKNFKTSKETRQIVERLLDQLNEEKIRCEIDAPIDEVIDTFSFPEEESCSSESFHHVIAEFVRLLYAKSLRFKQVLSSEDALTKAIFLLEIGYRGRSANGYDAALYNVSDENNDGTVEVLQQIADTLKGIERDNYMHRILNTGIGTFDWKTKSRVVEFLKSSPYLSEHLTCDLAEDLAENWQDLFLVYREIVDSKIF